MDSQTANITMRGYEDDGLGWGKEHFAKKLIRDEFFESKPRFKGTVAKIVQYLIILIMSLGEFDMKHMIRNRDMRPEVPDLYDGPGIIKLPLDIGNTSLGIL